MRHRKFSSYKIPRRAYTKMMPVGRIWACLPLMAALLAINPAAMAQPASTTSEPTTRIVALHCDVFAKNSMHSNRWLPGESPFGVPYHEWSEKEFNALKKRARECGNVPYNGSITPTIRIESEQGRYMMLADAGRKSKEQEVRVYEDWADRQFNSAVKEASVEGQIRQLEYLRSTNRGRSQKVDEKISAALKAAQDRRAEEENAREREKKLQAAEREVEESRRAVAQADADARLRQENARKAAADRTERDRRAAQAHTQEVEQEARMQSLAAEKKALDARRAEQEQQRIIDDEAIKQRLAEVRQHQEQERRAEQERVAKGQAVAAVERRKKLERIFVRHQVAISKMSFPAGYLDSVIMLNNYGGGYEVLAKFREWIALLLEAGEFDIRSISAFDGTRHRISMKRTGRPTTNVVFRKDGGELYLAGFGEGDRVIALGTDESQYVSAVLHFQLNDVVQKTTAAEHVVP